MDIILGMNWMGVHGVVLDTLSQSVHINFPNPGFMALNLRDHMPFAHMVNQVEAKTLA